MIVIPDPAALEIGELDFTVSDIGQYVGKRAFGAIKSSHEEPFILWEIISSYSLLKEILHGFATIKQNLLITKSPTPRSFQPTPQARPSATPTLPATSPAAAMVTTHSNS